MDYQTALIDVFGKSAMDAASAHARSEFPKECCGYISGGVYVACENKAAEPQKDFLIDNPSYTADYIAGKVQAIVHSHPGGPIFPSEKDMQQQLATVVPWVIINLNEVTMMPPVAWGDTLPIAPIIGRPFVHGIFDCYAVVRDLFRLGKNELIKQGIKSWPYDPVSLSNFARVDGWWKNEKDDLYTMNFASQGFKKIVRTEAKPGDCFLLGIGDRTGNPHERINHAGALIGDEMVIHHLPTRLSVRQPAGLWAHAAHLWLRYEGKLS